MKRIIREKRGTEWEKLERETNHDRLLTLGNEQRVVEGEVGGGMGDGHWGGHSMGWALSVILYVGKWNFNKNKWKKKECNIDF